MSRVDAVIKNGKIAISGRLVDAGLAIDEGKIVGVMKEPHLPEADRVIDVKRNLVLPGIIDMHVHFRDPGLTHKEDFQTGTTAAAAGGVTIAIDMPNTKPPVWSVKNFEDKKRIVEKKALIDFGLTAGVTKPKEIMGLKEAGASWFKVFTFKEEKEGLPHVPDLWAGDADQLYEICGLVAKTGLMLGFHADNYKIVNYIMREMISQGRNDPTAYVDPKFDVAETVDYVRMIAIAQALGTRLYILHAGSREGMDYVRLAKSMGQDVVVETCPYRLLITTEAVEKLGPYLSPLPQTGDVVEKLWEALIDGTIDVVSSDHAPHTKDEKEVGWKDIWSSPAGCPGVQTMLPLMLTQVNEGRISLQRLIELTAETPAKLLGLYPTIGAINVGSHANLTVVDMKKEDTINVDKLHTKVKWTLYDGWNVRGVPVLTMVRGEMVMEDGEVIGRPGYGEMIKANPIFPETKQE
ncbi:MAG: dihydroorotase family protein [Candidatus Geothermarchaeales archaeon]